MFSCDSLQRCDRCDQDQEGGRVLSAEVDVQARADHHTNKSYGLFAEFELISAPKGIGDGVKVRSHAYSMPMRMT